MTASQRDPSDSESNRTSDGPTYRPSVIYGRTMNVFRALIAAISLLLIGAFAPGLQAQCNTHELEIVDVTQPDSSGVVWVSVRRTNVSYIQTTWLGERQPPLSMAGLPNPYAFKLFLACMSGPSEFVVEDQGCPQVRQSRTLGPLDDTGTVKVVPVVDSDGHQKFHVTITDPYNRLSLLRSNWRPARGDAETGQDGSPYGPGKEYDVEKAGGTLEVIASYCPGKTARGEASNTVVDCEHCDNSCTQCRGEPVQVTNGNMRFRDADPIAGAPVVPFRRTYDSSVTAVGWFGPGVTTFLDPMLHLSADLAEAPGSVVSLLDEGGHAYLFRKIINTTAYLQVSPVPSGRPTTLLHDANGEWRHIDRDGRIARVFSDTGRILRYVDQRTGRATLIDFDGAGRPSAVRDSWGTWSWTLTFNTAVQRITRIAVDGHPELTWNYAYGTNQNHVVRAESPAGIWRQYDVTASGFYWSLVSAVRDGAGNILEQHDFDSAMRATSSYGPAGEISQFDYNLEGRVDGERLTRVSWKSGGMESQYLRWIAGEWRTVQLMGGCVACGSKNSVYAHDSGTGNTLREQDAAGYITENTYWPTGRLNVRRTSLVPQGCAADPNACRQTVESLATVVLDATSATMRTEYTYGDALWPDKPTVIRTTGVLSGDRVESFTYHAASGETLTHSVTGATGQPVRQETRVTTTAVYNGTEGAAFAPGGAFDPAWAALAQPASLRKSVDGPRTDAADITSVVYYPIATAVPIDWRGRLAAVRNAAGHITRYEDYDAFGNARRIVDPNGIVTETTYDALGRLLTSTLKGVPGCNTGADALCATDLVSTRTYNGAGPLVTETRPQGGVTVYEYDGRARVVKVSRGPSATSLLERIETIYDLNTGKKSIENVQAYESGAWVTKKSDSYIYDNQARLTSIPHTDGTSLVYIYDDRDQILTVQDENHTTPNTFYTYDPAGRLTRVEQTLAAGRIATTYAYDLAGNLTAVTDPNGNTTTYLYDDFGQMLQQVSPVTGTTTYTYNTAGLLTSSTDANGAVTYRTYDVLGRQTLTDSRRGTDREIVSFGYDTAGLGRLGWMNDPSGYNAYYYTRAGQLLSNQKNIEGTLYTIQRYQYDRDGNPTSMTYPSGRIFTYTYDYSGRPLTITTPGATLVSAASYLPFGPMTALTYGNGSRKEMTYDTRYRVQTNRMLGVFGSPIALYSYQYDPAGNITKIDDLIDASFNRQFGYDDLGRLVSTSTGALLWGTRTLLYDAMGNLKKTTLGATINYTGTLPKITNVVENGVTTPVTYDPAGNELSAGKTSTYSPRNYLASTSNAVMDYRFRYDGRGVRTYTSEDPIPTTGTYVKHYHHYTPDLRFLARIDYSVTGTTSSITRSLETIWFAGLPVAQIDYNDLGTLRYTFTDHLGTPTLQTSSTGSIIWQMEREPYGKLYRVRTGKESAQPIRLPGQEMAADGNESYNMFRWYRSAWGRYTQRDPVGRETYSYASNSPLGGIDPYGLYTLRVRGAAYPVSLRELDARCRDTNGNVTGGACTTMFVASARCPCSCNGGSWRMDITIFITFSTLYFDGAWPQLTATRRPHPSVTDSSSAINHEYDYHLGPAEQMLRSPVSPYEVSYPSNAECVAACTDLQQGIASEFRAWVATSQRIEQEGGDPRSMGRQ